MNTIAVAVCAIAVSFVCGFLTAWRLRDLYESEGRTLSRNAVLREGPSRT